MADRTTLQARREQLLAAIANPNSRVSADNKTVEKRSVADLQAALDIVNSELAALETTPPLRFARSVVGRGT
jgi:hypothetical protein